MVQTKPAPTMRPENPITPPGPQPIVFEQFQGINTAASRPGIEDSQMSWCDGFIPLGNRNLRTLYGVGPAIYTPGGNLGVVLFKFANIGQTPICVAFLSDGSIQQVNTNTFAVTRIAPAGTISSPSSQTVGVSQWGSQYVIITADQTNGYWLWDGTSFYGAGTIGPQITVTAGGSGYTSNPTATVSGGSGSGVTLSTSITNGVLTSISVLNPGSGYSIGNTLTVSITGGGGSGASATALIMPFGVQGNIVETYQSRVWVGNGAKITFTAPGSVIDFGTSTGGGSFTSRDSFLRVAFHGLQQTNGFLYLIADSSMNYISGVQTSGSPPTTTFTNQNADPEIGTPWPPSITVFSRNIVFGNAFGVHVSYGGSVAKVSEALDGVYNTVENFGNFTPSSAKAIIFGKKVWMILLPIIDPVTGQQNNKLFMWNQKYWWTSAQDVNLIYISTQEIDSVLTAYGTDGLSIYPLFQQPSTAFTKTVQSKLWDAPIGYEINKQAVRLWGIAYYYSDQDTDLNFAIDNENGASNQTISIGPQTVSVVNVNNDPVTVLNSLGAAVTILSSGTGVRVFTPTAIGQWGALIGLTMTTNAADMALLSVKVGINPDAYRG